jgi:Pyruvate/2-oxoacid:ferredoxin oxidoreductase delta subunit
METNDVYTELVVRLKDPGSKGLRRIMQKLVTQEEAELMLHLPTQPAELAEKAGLDEEEAQRILEEFMERGLVIRTSKGLYCLPHDMTQLHDANLSSADKWIDDELLQLWVDYRNNEWTAKIAEGLGDSYVQSIKVLPVWKAMEKSPDFAELLPEEDIRALLRSTDAVALVPCTCRRSIKNCDLPVEVCLQCNRGAEYSISRGAGHRISAEEAIAVADKSAEAGLIHTWPAGESGRLTAICNCCRDCCDIFAIGIKVGTVEQILQKSRFRAELDQDLCVGCEDCVGRCFFKAIETNGSTTIDEKKCFGCGLCAIVCEPEAITMKLAQT